MFLTSYTLGIIFIGSFVLTGFQLRSFFGLHLLSSLHMLFATAFLVTCLFYFTQWNPFDIIQINGLKVKITWDTNWILIYSTKIIFNFFLIVTLVFNKQIKLIQARIIKNK